MMMKNIASLNNLALGITLGRLLPKTQQTKMLVTCQRFGDLFLFGQYSSVQTKYNKGRFKSV